MSVEHYYDRFSPVEARVEGGERQTAMPAPALKRCPYCGEEIRVEAGKCRFCNEWLPGAFRPDAASGEMRYSHAQPITKLVLLSILTFGLYQFYWFYRNWKTIKAQTGVPLSPGWRTVGLFVPIVSIFMVNDQFKLIHTVASASGLRPRFSPGWLTLGYLVLTALSRLPDPWEMVELLSFLPLIPVQRALNEYWATEQPGRAVRTRYSKGEIAVLIVGGFLMAVKVIGMLAGDDPVPARGLVV